MMVTTPAPSVTTQLVSRSTETVYAFAVDGDTGVLRTFFGDHAEFIPDLVEVTIVDGRLKRIDVSGPLLHRSVGHKDGDPSHGNCAYGPRPYADVEYLLPRWARPILTDVNVEEGGRLTRYLEPFHVSWKRR